MVVAFRYSMKNESGVVLENCFDSAPRYYLHGATQIDPGLQQQFEGMKATESKTFTFNLSNQESNKYIFDVVIDEVRPASAEEIAQGYPVIPGAGSCDAGCDCH